MESTIKMEELRLPEEYRDARSPKRARRREMFEGLTSWGAMMSLSSCDQVRLARACSSGGHVLPATTTREVPFQEIRNGGVVVDFDNWRTRSARGSPVGVEERPREARRDVEDWDWVRMPVSRDHAVNKKRPDGVERR